MQINNNNNYLIDTLTIISLLNTVKIYRNKKRNNPNKLLFIDKNSQNDIG